MLRPAAAIVVALLLAAGCSDDGGDRDGAATTTAATPTTLGPAVMTFRPVLAAGPPQSCAPDDPDRLVAPGQAPQCLTLGPAPVPRVTFASIDVRPDPAGGASWALVPVLTDDATGIGALDTLAGPCFARAASCPTGLVALVVNGQVLSAPSIQAPTFEPDQIVVSGDFTEVEARDLARRLSA